MAKRKYYSASEQLQAMTSQWADNSAIKVIGGVGDNIAGKIRQAIQQQTKKDGYRLPRSAVVPMKYVIDYFNIDIGYLKKLAKLERGDENVKEN